MFWTDGSIYQGEWKSGIQHGFGKMTFPDGTVKEGKFENNIFLGSTLDPSHSGGDLLTESENGGGSGHKKSTRQLLQPLIIKKTNNNDKTAAGYNSSNS